MVLSVKCAGVWAFVFIAVKVSDRRPACKATAVVRKRAVLFKNTTVHGNILSENCVFRSVFSSFLDNSFITVYKSRKPVKLSCIADFVNCVILSITIDVILVGCQCCRLIGAAFCAETVYIVVRLFSLKESICIIYTFSCG